MILDAGGVILLARGAGTGAGQIIGTAALLNEGEGVFELSKMCVRTGLQGKGIGRKILLALLKIYDETPGARYLYLESNKKLVNALYLYEQCGFRHTPKPATAPAHYGRADVYMVYNKENIAPPKAGKQ